MNRKGQKNLTRHVLSGALAALLLAASAQPAHAQFVVTDPLGDLQKAFSAVVDNISKMLGLQAQTQIADTEAANAATQNKAKVAMDIAQKYYLPANYSACRVAQSARAAADDHLDGGAVTQALSQALSNRPSTPANNAKDIKAECGLGFAPTDSGDPEAAIYKSLGCNSDGKHARQDRTIEAVLGQREFPVPPSSDFQAPVNGVYQRMTQVSDPKYYPFAAALSFCQHVNPPLPPPPQIAQQGSIDALIAGRYADMEAFTSVGSTSCIADLEKRMQYGTNVDSAYAQRHKDQVTRCIADNAAHYIDDNMLQDCQLNGRSELQADYDKAFRRGAKTYQLNVVGILPTDAQTALNEADANQENDFNNQLIAEREQLIAAMTSAAHGATVSSNAALAQKAEP